VSRVADNTIYIPQGTPGMRENWIIQGHTQSNGLPVTLPARFSSGTYGNVLPFNPGGVTIANSIVLMPAEFCLVDPRIPLTCTSHARR
jgi:hypothetical protein